MAKWIAEEKARAGLRQEGSNMLSERDEKRTKERIAQSKPAARRAGSLAHG